MLIAAIFVRCCYRQLNFQTMIKKEFAKQVFQLVQNSIEEEKSEVEIIDDVEIFLDTLEPRDREQFAKWGYPSVQVEPSKCWV